MKFKDPTFKLAKQVTLFHMFRDKAVEINFPSAADTVTKVKTNTIKKACPGIK